MLDFIYLFSKIYQVMKKFIVISVFVKGFFNISRLKIERIGSYHGHYSEI